MVASISRRSPRSSRSDPNVDRLVSSVGGTGRRAAAAPTTASCRPPEAARASASSCVDEIMAELRPQARRRPRRAGLPAEPAADPHRRTGDQEPLPVLAAVARTRRAVRLARRSSSKELREAARAAGRHQRPADQQPAGQRRTSTATRPPRCRSTPSRSRMRSTTPTARAGSRPSTRPTNQYKVLLELQPEYQTRSQRAVDALLQGRDAAG